MRAAFVFLTFLVVASSAGAAVPPLTTPSSSPDTGVAILHRTDATPSDCTGTVVANAQLYERREQHDGYVLIFQGATMDLVGVGCAGIHVDFPPGSCAPDWAMYCDLVNPDGSADHLTLGLDIAQPPSDPNFVYEHGINGGRTRHAIGYVT